MAKTCSETCQHLLAEQTRQGLRDSGDYAPMARGYTITPRKMNPKICVGCGESFTPTTPSQERCQDPSLEISCGMCGSIFSPRRTSCGQERQIYCDLICSTLGTTGSEIPPERIPEFKNIDQWARDFAKANGRKPSRLDIRIYFKIATTSRIDPQLLNRSSSRSPLETYVFQELRKILGPDEPILQERQPLRDSNGNRYELDIWIPRLNLAFEVQDLATHSRTSDEELVENKFGKWIPLKKGPANHELKRKLAAAIGVKLVDIWEDEILAGNAPALLVASIEQASTQDH